ncbi:VOC family protein [Paradevosia shaoguanensis]|uniref:VOC family protein n=1 Tax=Paradevosia shaoguanensis TaxID=1335043 RepID=A0AA41QPQ4_9HYPH|nr:VOC family protein [Paradevosia shaoguanensis]KFL27299.1 hypothetical protein JP74_08345 [Devosia sp. 17-2-E-8]QMV00950.1 hypothetical protein GHV40_05375 [Devosia sp. D6-9]CDP52440.1 hypothetical protein [Devosia sp. DBB001]MCF1744263.1 VOC family protein [Paradevosia shaoguanensis]MCI0128746.1 VOC family protein [Paradevosia shaoguanensis]
MPVTHRIRFNILCKDLSDSAAFYQRVFGMVETETHGWLRVFSLPGETRLELGLIDEVSEFVPRGARGIVEGAYITFVIEDVVAAVHAAHAEGVEIVEDARGFGNAVHAVIRDPNGIVIDLFTPEAAVQMPPSELLAG